MLHVPPKDMSRKAVRARLRNPSHAVPDLGIDLRNPRKLPPMVEPVKSAAVSAEIIPPVEASILHPADQKIRVRTVQDAVCEHYKIGLIDLISERRAKTLVLPRHVAMYLAKNLTMRSLPEIGRLFGGRDHTTVLHAVRKIDGIVSSDAELAGQIEQIKTRILAKLTTVHQLRCVVRTHLRPQQCNWHVNITTSTQQ